MEDIANMALKGHRPPNFNDQCAAFIASDIKNAIHEGVKQEDIVAGLVYSICMNYVNRVKGNRPVGEKVFMQGGVCYNRAVPLAMAALVGKPIIVPPEPGLMGAFGVALVIRERVNIGLMQKKSFSLKSLANRKVIYRNSFACKGGKEKCDRRCEIAVVQLERKKYTFGGACNRYYNLRHNLKYDIQNLDLISVRQRLIFEKYAARPTEKSGWVKKGSIGFNRSFLVNTYYPLYSTFFAELGFEPILAQSPSQIGIDLKEAPFCYPVELAHGFFYSLISSDDVPDYLFLPHFRAVPNLDDHKDSQVCPLIQGEAYYLQTTFKDRLNALKQLGVSLLTPILDLTGGLEDARSSLIQTARQMGIRRKDAKKAFETASERQLACFEEMKTLGKAALKTLSKDFEKSGVVIFGRPYNGFADEAHMGIPNKLASRGIMVIPFDFLPFEDQESKRHMYWGMGQLILKTSRMVKQHPQLFGTYVTNFSCGPDSFLIGYFRDLMGRKPSLTLELDSHTADAGLETRIEAFLDIVTAYRQLHTQNRIAGPRKLFTPCRTVLNNGSPKVIISDGQTLPMTDPRVSILFPSMGNLASESIAAIFQGSGYHAKVHPPSDEEILKLGRANTSCKECLPLILTTGTLLNYIQNKREKGEVVVYFMPTGSGPCRFGQYYIFMEDLIRRLKIPDVALFSLSSDNGYMGLNNGFQKKSWWGIIVSDVMEDIRSMLLANASDPQKAIAVFDKEWQNTLVALKTGEFNALASQMMDTADRFQKIPLKKAVQEVPTIALVGEIFVRRDHLSRQFLTEKLAEKGFATICSPIAEWMWYSDYIALNGLTSYSPNLKEKLGFMLKKFHMGRYEKRLKTLLLRSGLVHTEPVDIKRVIENARPYIAPELTGEAILTVGSALMEVVSNACGVIAIGPFGCMPNRLAEAILSQTMTGQAKLATDPTHPYLKAVLSDIQDLPFLAIESDGSPFPQLINANVESFCLRAKRLHEKMLLAH
jgi:predicted nucleotide-binding protein (sugar kinase/HSP70/actin superfamily)